MAKLIPGKLRMEGVTLYETGNIEIIKEKGNRLYTRVAGEDLRYSLEDDLVFCACDFFQKRGYCVHLAALEHYLKNDEEGQVILRALEKGHEEQEEVETKVSFGGSFLERIQPQKREKIYTLSAQGQVEAGTNRLLWTLRIGLVDSQKYYVIRDIPLFLKVLVLRKSYMIGKHYENDLSWEAFDTASQDVLTFLCGLIEEGLSQDLFFPNQGRHLFFPLTFFEQGVELLMNLEDFHFEHQITSYENLLFHDLDPDAGLFSFSVQEYPDYFEMEISESERVNVFYGGAVLFLKGNLYLLNPKQISLLKEIKELPREERGKKCLQFDNSDRDRLAACLPLFGQLGTVSAPERLQIRSFSPIFYFDREDDGRIRLDIQFDYGDLKVTSQQQLEQLPFSSDAVLENQLFQVCLGAGFEADFQSWRQALKPEAVYSFFHHTIPAFEKLGQIFLSDEMDQLYSVQAPQVQIESKGGLLEIQFDFQGIAQEEIDQALKALTSNQDFYISFSDQVYFFDEETKQIRQNLQELGVELKDGSFQARKSLAYSLSQLFEGRDRISFSEEFQHLAHDLTHPEDFPLGDIRVQASLRDYQEKGVRWLQMLHHYGFGGILADDMGLGKTLQTIAFLTSQVTEDSRVLILAPSGLIYNWADEFRKFAPQLDLAVVHGLKANREAILSENHQIYVTSYATFRQDSELYQEMAFDFLFLDEAQVMKNAQTKIAQSLRQFVVPAVFALSGTPIENHLGELWSIFQIVLPGLLPSKKEFMKLPADRVAQFIKPFVMRRKKEEVLTELPDLIEVVYKNELEDQQKAIYLAQLQQMRDRLAQVTDQEFQRSRVEILSGLMRLRQICDTPALFMDDYQGASGKLDSLRDLLLQVADGGHRVLIFSQFKGMLEKIEKELPDLGLTSFKITGSTPAHDRQEMTKAFNQGERDAFLISLKAGGVGLNLTGADTVILVDLWWNPAVEAQAIGRAHRMGQEQMVEVYRLITKGTIEEKIQELQEQKKHLVSQVLDGTESRASLSLAEIREILGISEAST
ncbi:DEAD/DEAH box helicase [Streptococcus oralis]|uniref:RNA helicase n=1 Tax=Streptococcus oralis subsp. tigurinus 2426 TaxID=1333865 RepID=S9RER0_STROR|nr:DEAD/DEAH box helicase [Streptococcus oralis]EMG34323.1 superfamily II DNA/RNA helicase [Streptococcus oralis subsp. tigurinus 1366]EPX88785.1 RNA helicase [Streptococcus oralis subsp. tigurinus 2425]EPX90377.1 RNA helicase [Streptococcus oralis subsp. tigurinus 2426]